LRQIGLRCLVHLATDSALPDDLGKELRTAQHHSRSLNHDGSGQVFEHQLRARLEKEGISIPGNFTTICNDCQHHNQTPEVALDSAVLDACILIDTKWPDALLREAFSILNRSREVQDLITLADTDQSNNYEGISRKVDPEAIGDIDYDTFLNIMEAEKP